MRYQEYQPSNELAEWVKLFWVFECRSEGPQAETIVADGFPELIIHFRAPFTEEDHAGRLVPQSSAVACGQLTKPLTLHSSTDAGMLGIRFHPGGMAPLLSTSMQALTDARLPAVDILPNIERLVEEVCEATTDPQRVQACERYLHHSLIPDRRRLCIRKAVDTILASQGTIAIEQLANLAGVSRRSLELAFQRDLGISPKMCCRIARFRHVYDALTEDDAPAHLVQVALDAGFFDQSHLVRDFRQFTGNSPSKFLAGQTQFAGSVN